VPSLQEKGAWSVKKGKRSMLYLTLGGGRLIFELRRSRRNTLRHGWGGRRTGSSGAYFLMLKKGGVVSVDELLTGEIEECKGGRSKRLGGCQKYRGEVEDSCQPESKSRKNGGEKKVPQGQRGKENGHRTRQLHSKSTTTKKEGRVAGHVEPGC